MSKKKKHNLQKLIVKKQKLQQIVQGAAISPSETAQPYHRPEATLPAAMTDQPKTTPDRALHKTAVSIIIIILLLVAAIIFDKKLPYLNQFGDWIYQALKLQN